jgi:hypothetical protein
MVLHMHIEVIDPVVDQLFVLAPLTGIVQPVEFVDPMPVVVVDGIDADVKGIVPG